jgi:hypothetical protein
VENEISENKLELKIYDLNKNYFKELIDEYKNIEYTKKNDRCLEIQYMKFIWFSYEDSSYDYYFWIDAGLSHCGLIPDKHRTFMDTNNYRKYYESNLFNNDFLNNLISETGEKFTIIGKENNRNYWSGTVNPIHFTNYDRSYHVIGGLFGGKKELWVEIVKFFKDYLVKVTNHDKKLYHEEDIMTLMFRNHEELFNVLKFDTWWHEDEKILDIKMQDFLKENKSFYKILEELNKIN